MEIGIQISSVKQYLQTPQDVLSSFQKVARSGYRWIQIQWISLDVPPEATRDALLETGMTCVGTQDYTHEVLPRLDEVIRWNDLWGGKYVCISGIPPHQLTEQGCMEFAGELNQVSRRLADCGKILQFHPRKQDILLFDGHTSLDIFTENIDNFQLLPDLYHIIAAGIDPASWLANQKGQIDMVHFKDSKLQDGARKLTPVGQGDTDWEPIYRTCVQKGVRWAFAEQEQWEKDAFVCLEESYQHMMMLKSKIE